MVGIPEINMAILTTLGKLFVCNSLFNNYMPKNNLCRFCRLKKEDDQEKSGIGILRGWCRIDLNQGKSGIFRVFLPTRGCC
jgi:hypothetical protein